MDSHIVLTFIISRGFIFFFCLVCFRDVKILSCCVERHGTRKDILEHKYLWYLMKTNQFRCTEETDFRIQKDDPGEVCFFFRLHQSEVTLIGLEDLVSLHWGVVVPNLKPTFQLSDKMAVFFCFCVCVWDPFSFPLSWCYLASWKKKQKKKKQQKQDSSIAFLFAAFADRTRGGKLRDFPRSDERTPEASWWLPNKKNKKNKKGVFRCSARLQLSQKSSTKA